MVLGLTCLALGQAKCHMTLGQTGRGVEATNNNTF